MVKLFLKDNATGVVHEYGRDWHDSLILQEDGSLHYYNLQNGCGTMFPVDGYSFCFENGTVPELLDETPLDVGGVRPRKPILKSGKSFVHRDYKDGSADTTFEKWSVWVCPECNHFVGERYTPHFVGGNPHDQKKCKYCQNCGQAIDWNVKETEIQHENRNKSTL